jgi:hypothetical protein
MRLILVTDSADSTDRSRDLVTAFLEGKGWSVWHWFKDLWLIDGAPDDQSLASLREELQNVMKPQTRIMIMTTEGVRRHSGTVPTGGIPWLKEHWGAK